MSSTSSGEAVAGSPVAEPPATPGGSARVWTLSYAGRPNSLNAERSGHWAAHRQTTAEWRDAFGWLAVKERLPHLDLIHVVAQPFHARSRLPDTGNCYPAVKAAIDGLVDAHVIDDDGPERVRSITLLAPQRGPDGLTLTITEVRP